MTSIATCVSPQLVQTHQANITGRSNAVTWNNNAARDIEERQFLQAIDQLSSALKESKQSMSENSDGKESVLQVSLDNLMIESQKISKRRNCQENAAPIFPPAASEKISALEQAGDQPMSDPSLPHHGKHQDCYQLYRTPIHLPSQLLAETNDRDNIILSAVIIFNLAVAYHLYALDLVEEGTRSNDEIAKHIRKSIKLYEFAIQIQREAGIDCDSSTLFVLSTLNNLGAAYHGLGEMTLSNAHFQRLLSFLMYLVESHHVAPELMSHFNLYFDNTFHLVCDNRGKAAPAA